MTAEPPGPETLRWSLAGITAAARAAHLAGGAFDPFFQEAWSAAQIGGLLCSSDSWLQLAESDDALLVAFALCRKAADEVELLLCATAALWRRRGIGLELIRRVAGQSRGRGAGRLFLEVRASNAAALALYRRFGFVEDGRRPGYYHTISGDRIDAITLSVRL